MSEERLYWKITKDNTEEDKWVIIFLGNYDEKYSTNTNCDKVYKELFKNEYSVIVEAPCRKIAAEEGKLKILLHLVKKYTHPYYEIRLSKETGEITVRKIDEIQLDSTFGTRDEGTLKTNRASLWICFFAKNEEEAKAKAIIRIAQELTPQQKKC